MNAAFDLEPSQFEKIVANTLKCLEETALFTPEELALLREAAATGSLSRAKEVETILERGMEATQNEDTHP
jgi:hypothetical protein